ncbi:MAG: LAGLIDADG family homing endonuclease [Thermoproteota archaeon]
MGGGSRVKQYERRFYEGEQVRGEREEESFHAIRTFEKYEVREAEGGGYELLKGGEVIGIFSEAKVEEGRIVFKLSKGMSLEILERKVREILAPEKAELCGLIGSDGGIYINSDKGVYEVYFDSEDRELAELFINLIGEVYHETARDYIRFEETGEGEKAYHKPRIYSKKIAYDLADLGIKGPEDFEFHPPVDHLDEEGKRAYLRGFFSGDGNISMTEGGRAHSIRIYSTYKEGLEEVRQMFIDLGFHPHEIRTDHRKPGWRDLHSFTIPAEDHLKFIEEIGSRKPEHVEKLQLIKTIDERRKQD